MTSTILFGIIIAGSALLLAARNQAEPSAVRIPVEKRNATRRR